MERLASLFGSRFYARMSFSLYDTSLLTPKIMHACTAIVFSCKLCFGAIVAGESKMWYCKALEEGVDRPLAPGVGSKRRIAAYF
jgi:hypothetical protein